MPGAQALTASPQQPPTTGAPVPDLSERIRLHITPLNPTLLKAILPPALLPSATNITYHTVQTFPEKGYGYVELPTMEAQKLKKKLNGSILKGTKVRIEDARPEKRKAGDPAAEEVGEEQAAKEVKRRKKAKREEGVLPGFELPEGRKVRRGWTEPGEQVKGKKSRASESKDKAKKQKVEVSKYSREPEMLFKTVVPANKAEVKPEKKEKSKEKEKSKDEAKKPRLGKKSVTVHELSKTMKYATFLKDSPVPKDGKMVAEYVEGKGWTDAQGNVVEPESGRRSKRKRHTVTDGATKVPVAKTKASKQPTNNSAEPESDEAEGKAVENKKEHVFQNGPMEEPIKDSPETKEARRQTVKEVEAPQKFADHDDEEDSDDGSSVISTSSSDVSSTSSESDSQPPSAYDGEEADEAETPPALATPTGKANDTTPQREVHPLEALFKTKTPGSSGAPRPAPINTSFTFFDEDAGEKDEDSTAANQPTTPFTRRDLDYRGLRSAAPTPDTAAIGLKFKVPWKDDDEEDEEHDSEEGTSMVDADANSTPLGNKKGEIKTADDEEMPESDFAKWFWEHRGETNRAWKRRRREVLKAKRQRENRKMGSRLV